MAKIGIIADAHKVDRFEKVLKEKGFIDYTTQMAEGGLVVIKVNTSMENQSKINAICTEVELHFKQSN